MAAGEWPRRPNSGFSLLWVLAAIAIVSVSASAVVESWSQVRSREKEDELIRVGALFARAIKSYRDASPGSARRYPPELANLLEDDRMIGTTRHIRKLYADPITPSAAWGIARAPDGGVAGVFSQSEKRPFRTASVDIGVAVLPSATRYSQWKFAPVGER